VRPTFSIIPARPWIHVAAQNPGTQRCSNLSLTLADTRKDNFARICAGGDRAHEFAAADDVKAAARTRNEIEHGQIGVGFHRIADEARRPAARGVGAQRRVDRAARIT